MEILEEKPEFQGRWQYLADEGFLFLHPELLNHFDLSSYIFDLQYFDVDLLPAGSDILDIYQHMLEIRFNAEYSLIGVSWLAEEISTLRSSEINLIFDLNQKDRREPPPEFLARCLPYEDVSSGFPPIRSFKRVFDD